MIPDDTLPVEPWQIREPKLNLDVLAQIGVAVRTVQRAHRNSRQPRRR